MWFNPTHLKEAKAKAAREADSDYESEDESEYSEEGIHGARPEIESTAFTKR